MGGWSLQEPGAGQHPYAPSLVSRHLPSGPYGLKFSSEAIKKKKEERKKFIRKDECDFWNFLWSQRKVKVEFL